MGKSLYELVKRTSASGAVEWHLFADRPDRPMHVPNDSCEVSVFETRGYRFAAWEQFSLPAAAARLGVDVLHSPATTAPWWQPLPTVVTVHDTIPWRSQDDPHWRPGLYRDRVLADRLPRASAVMTFSNTSRRDLLARWPALQPKIHVISPGVDERYLDAEPDQQPIVPRRSRRHRAVSHVSSAARIRASAWRGRCRRGAVRGRAPRWWCADSRPARMRRSAAPCRASGKTD